MVRFLDAFSGVGGFRLAAETSANLNGTKASFVASIEISPKAREIYKKNFGDDPLVDITKINPADLPDFDVLMGGFPCPSFSKNGKHFNFTGTSPEEDPRTDLFENLVRILETKRPSGYVFENVKEIASIRHYSGQKMIEHVTSRIKSLGYSADWRMLDSSNFGLAQQRKRIYISGLSSGEPANPPDSWFIRTPAVKDIMDEEASSPKLLLSHYMKRRSGASPAKLARRIREASENESSYSLPLLVHTLQQAGSKSLSRFDLLKLSHDSGQWTIPKDPVNEIVPVAVIYGMTPSTAPRQQDKLYSRMGISPTIATFSTPAFDHPKGYEHWRLLSPRECARLQGFPDSFVLPTSLGDGYKAMGNAVSVPVASAVISGVLQEIR